MIILVVLAAALYIAVAVVYFELMITADAIVDAIFGFSIDNRWTTPITTIKAAFWPVMALIYVVLELGYQLADHRHR